MSAKIIGLTGGIGSGKSRVASYLKTLDFPVYSADASAKTLMHTNANLKTQIIALFGEEAYGNGQLNRSLLAESAFKNPTVLAQLNALVHPVVAKDFLEWRAAQTTPYVVKEAAILFETGGAAQCDITLLITAPENTRLKRVMQRDGVTKNAVKERMARQWKDEEKILLADKVIENIEWETTKVQLDDWIKNL